VGRQLLRGLFFGLLVFGPGVGLGFVAAGLGARELAEHESGLVSRLSITTPSLARSASPSSQLSPVSRCEDYLAANDGATRSSS
jgi:hypothetical protein